ncbi:iron chaperone [Cohnella caldifontis]|uniref:iron chaperone n=1 Tax=Cohnella caldifontis TaxID=3027471 RepID=UPI0023EDCDE2|nr:DUF1801 domain-containing protein [Cohnella sp. YIM B05605]
MATKTNFQTVDEYIGTFPPAVQDGLEQIRRTVKEAVPEAKEMVHYQLPAYEYQGMLIYYSAYKGHYSVTFPPPFKIFEAFRQELSPYEVSKTTIKLPMDQPLPLDLVAELAKYRAKENAERSQKKKK